MLRPLARRIRVALADAAAVAAAALRVAAVARIVHADGHARAGNAGDAAADRLSRRRACAAVLDRRAGMSRLAEVGVSDAVTSTHRVGERRTVLRAGGAEADAPWAGAAARDEREAHLVVVLALPVGEAAAPPGEPKVLGDGLDSVFFGRGAVAAGEASEEQDCRDWKSPNDGCSMSEVLRHDYLRRTHSRQNAELKDYASGSPFVKDMTMTKQHNLCGAERYLHRVRCADVAREETVNEADRQHELPEKRAVVQRAFRVFALALAGLLSGFSARYIFARAVCGSGRM